MSRLAHDRFERVAADCYESMKPEVLVTVRGKLAVKNLHPDPLDLDAAYNQAWHCLYQHTQRGGEEVDNLVGWLANTAYRRAIDDIRASKLQYRAPVTVEESRRGLGYHPDLDGGIDDQQRYHKWLLSLRLRLSPREQEAVCLCVLHGLSRADASEIMGVHVKRLDKIMVEAGKKLGGLLETINRGEWCEDQHSLIKAFALGLHQDGGERHQLAVAHLMECQACAAYVRSLRGLTVVLPAPAILAGAATAGGGVLGGLTGLGAGGAGGAAAVSGGGAATGGGMALFGGLGAKGAAICATAVCAVGGAAVIIERPTGSDPKPNPAPAAASRPAVKPAPPAARPPPKPAATAAAPKKRSPGSSKKRASNTSRQRTPVPDPTSQGAQEISELGVEPQATEPVSASPPAAAATPRPPAASEFGIGP